MTSLPLFHINAPAYSVMGSLACGAGLVLLPRFSASGFLDSARQHGATEFNAIGAMLEILMRQPERPDDAQTPLRLCYTGPAPERERQLEMEPRFGLRIVVGYAMSESPYGLIWARGTRPYGTLGSARQHPVLGVVNEARVVATPARDLGPGRDRRAAAAQPRRDPRLLGHARGDRRVLTADGWLHTGDLVTVNADGTYTFVSRIRRSSGAAARTCRRPRSRRRSRRTPPCSRCAVVGVPSELTEEEVKAFIVAAPGVEPDFAELHAFAAERLAAFKVPAVLAAGRRAAPTPTAGWPSTGSRQATRPASTTPAPARDAAAPAPAGPMSLPLRGDQVTDYPTSIGTADADLISLLGHDLATEMMGQVSFGEPRSGSSRCAGPSRGSCGCSRPCSSRWPTTGSPRPPSPPGSP